MCGGSKGQSTSKQNSQSSNSYTPAGLQDIQQIFNQASQASQIPYVPYSGQLVAPLNAEQQTAAGNMNNAVGMAQPYINASAGLFGEASQNPNTNGLIQSFYNPMASNVMANLNEVFGQQMAQTTGNLQQGAGGIGADRIAVGQSELARQQGLAAGQTMAQLYGQAQQAAQQQQGLEQASAFGFGQLGPAAEQAMLSGSAAQLGVGTLEQQTQQNLLNANYQQFLRQQGYPFQTAGFLGSVGLPAATSMGGTGTGTSTGMTTYTPPQPSPISQGLGLGIGLLGAFAPGVPAAKGGRIKRDAGGVIPFNPNNETEFNISGSVPQTQMQQGQAYNPMAMAPMLAGYSGNQFTGGNSMYGGNAAAAQAATPSAQAANYRNLFKQGHDTKAGLDNLVDKGVAKGWLDPDDMNDLGLGTSLKDSDESDAMSLDESASVPGEEAAARGGRFATGGSPFENSDSWRQFTQQQAQLRQSGPVTQEQIAKEQMQDNPLGIPMGHTDAQLFSPQQWRALVGMQQQAPQQQSQSQPQSQAGPAPFVPSQTSVGDLGPSAPLSSSSPFSGISIPQLSGNNNSTFDPTGGGSLSLTPDWLKSGGLQSGLNPALSDIERPNAPSATLAGGGRLRGFEGGGDIGDDDSPFTLPDVGDRESFIRNYAASIGEDPDVVVRGAQHEGLTPGTWQSSIVKNGVREPSYGDFQLNDRPSGLGPLFRQQTGLDPSNPRNWQAMDRFAMDYGKEHGWSPWMGFKAAGITGKTGISPVQAGLPVDPGSPSDWSSPGHAGLTAIPGGSEAVAARDFMTRGQREAPLPGAAASAGAGSGVNVGASANSTPYKFMGSAGASAGADPGEQGGADLGAGIDVRDFRKWRQNVGDAADEVRQRSQIPTFLGKPMTPQRMALIEAGAAMMASPSPWAAQGIGQGIAAGARGLEDSNNLYLNQARENLTAQDMAAKLYQPVFHGIYDQAYTPTGQLVPGTGPDAPGSAISKLMPDAETMDRATNQYISGDKAAITSLFAGRGGQGVAPYILKEANKMITDKLYAKYGHTPEAADHIITAQADVKSLMTAAGRAGTLETNIGVASQKLDAVIPVVSQLSHSIPRSQIPIINDASLKVMAETGNADVKRFATSLIAARAAYDRAINPSGVPTNDQRKASDDLINWGLNTDQIDAVLDQMKQEVDLERGGLGKYKQQLHDEFIKAHGGAPGSLKFGDQQPTATQPTTQPAASQPTTQPAAAPPAAPPKPNKTDEELRAWARERIAKDKTQKDAILHGLASWNVSTEGL